ncbi:MAG: hypothetical protein IKH57_06165 [Clostridia bacterium]|nr:hypothetical protein [Clostridia bacterium]
MWISTAVFTAVKRRRQPGMASHTRYAQGRSASSAALCRPAASPLKGKEPHAPEAPTVAENPSSGGPERPTDESSTQP